MTRCPLACSTIRSTGYLSTSARDQVNLSGKLITLIEDFSLLPKLVAVLQEHHQVLQFCSTDRPLLPQKSDPFLSCIQSFLPEGSLLLSLFASLPPSSCLVAHPSCSRTSAHCGSQADSSCRYGQTVAWILIPELHGSSHLNFSTRNVMHLQSPSVKYDTFLDT